MAAIKRMVDRIQSGGDRHADPSPTPTHADPGTPTPVPTPTPPPAPATPRLNYAHVQAGRAHDGGGYALANGSNQNMGLDNVYYQTTLKQTGPNYYVIGTCP